MTHAFFKALLFLASGSVIHAMSNEQDMRVMGGLRGRLPITYRTFLIGTLAIAGIFPLAGFFSKDEILWFAFSSPGGGVVLWAIGFLVAGLTAFYMMRLVVLTFYGENRASTEVRDHIHESPPTMTVPLVILAILSVIGGWIGWPHFLGGANHFEQWLAPVFASAGGHAADVAGGTSQALESATHGTEHLQEHGVGSAGHDTQLEWILAVASFLWAVLGLGLGYWVYSKRASLADSFRRLAGGSVYRLLLNKYYVDEIYEAVFVRPGFYFSNNVLWKWIDVGVIDMMLVNGTAFMVAVTGMVLRLFQNGLVRFYAYSFGVGVTLFVVYLSLSG